MMAPLVSRDAERAVLGSCLIDRDAIAVALPVLEPSDFISDERHRVFYKVMCNLWERRVPIDLVTFVEALREAPEADRLDLPEAYVAELLAETLTSVHVRYYADIVKKYALSERLRHAADHGDLDAVERYAAELRLLASGDLDEPEQRFRLYTTSQLQELPDPEYLIEKILVTDALATLYGDAGTFKTFAGVSMGLSVASGMTWHGRRVKAGPVVYVVSEGARGIKRRIRAWEAHHGRPAPETFYVLPDTVRVLDTGDVGAFCALLATLPEPPVMIVFDTLNRALDGGDENSASDMGRAISAMDRVRAATGAAVLVIHHGTKTGQWARGHSSLRGAMQTEIEAEVDGTSGRIILRCRKQKDDAPFPAIGLETRAYDLGDGESSVVLVPTDAPIRSSAETREEERRRQREALAMAVLDGASDEGLGYNEWVRRTSEALGMSEKTAKRVIADLKLAGRVGLSTDGAYIRSRDNQGQTGVMTLLDPGQRVGSNGVIPFRDDPVDPSDPTSDRDPWNEDDQRTGDD